MFNFFKKSKADEIKPIPIEALPPEYLAAQLDYAIFYTLMNCSNFNWSSYDALADAVIHQLEENLKQGDPAELRKIVMGKVTLYPMLMKYVTPKQEVLKKSKKKNV